MRKPLKSSACEPIMSNVLVSHRAIVQLVRLCLMSVLPALMIIISTQEPVIIARVVLGIEQMIVILVIPSQRPVVALFVPSLWTIA